MIFIDGFEEFAGQSSPAELLKRAEWIPQGTWTAVGGRSSTSGSTALAAAGGSLTRTFPWSTNKFVVGIAAMFAARGSLMTLRVGGAKVTLWLHPETGLPMLNDQGGGALPTVNRWYYYELEIDKLAGKVNLYINNRLDASLALPMPGPAVEVVLGYTAPADYGQTFSDGGQKYLDDFQAYDGERVGPIIITTRFPSIDKHTEWFAAATSGSHAQSLSMRPPSPLDNYVASDTIGKEDRFTSGTELANDDTILATGILVMARKSPTLNARLGVFMGGQAGAPLRAADRQVESEWRTQYICFDKMNGDTPAGIEASEFGINVAAP